VGLGAIREISRGSSRVAHSSEIPILGPKTTLGGPLGTRLGARLGRPLIDKYF